jgi:hypothetical protein
MLTISSCLVTLSTCCVRHSTHATAHNGCCLVVMFIIAASYEKSRPSFSFFTTLY